MLSHQTFRRRVLVLFFVFTVLCALVVIRLMRLQILVNPELAALAAKQFRREYSVAPYRLPIYDRNGEELAISVSSSSAFARPRLIRNKTQVARQLATILGGTPERWLARLKSSKPFVWLQRQLPLETARNLSAKNIRGVFVEPENKRIYPNGMLAAQVLGFTDIDGNGLAGLELSLDRELLQQETKFALSRDGRGTLSYLDRRYAQQHTDRKGVYITLDRRLQHALESEVEKAMTATQARAVMAIVIDPSTGEILAMGQRPSFDPNHVSQAQAEAISNRLISHLYEPGSTLKVVFAAKALESRTFNRKTPVDCEGGKLTIGTKTIREAESNHRYGVIPFEDVLRFSSNVGIVKIAQVLGRERVRNALIDFGLTSKTGVRLPGEASSFPRPNSFWTPIHLATVAFGQGISTTPLQSVLAFAPFANGGYRIRPKILLNEPMRLGKNDTDAKRVISPNTALAMRDLLLRVTELAGSTGVAARVEGIHIAGKTGTAQKYSAGVGYQGNKYFSSFIGFLPSEKPELLIGVMVDEPQGSYYASKVAAPLFRSLADRSMQILDRYPKRTAVSPVRIASLPLDPPRPRMRAAQVDSDHWTMPDLRGVSFREALRVAGSLAASVECKGSGYVESQWPAPQTLIEKNAKVRLVLSPSAGTQESAGPADPGEKR